ncbi:hypothetical protein A3H89_01850 [Candidatus Amesbacteria bacterium RIFCSPLOWO2_02_FULL_48_11]|uniref:Plasmid stabilization protein n=3 Tax=Candidatus Amesiibacteriota TaxID=1752730 RepID=A0A1F4Z8J0_9BACT|nr:MAG: Plasmid stabilization system [Candidatus Amesbacteria bacterium GW2011_GWC1_48_10]OGC90244.1 MAG: hypothetical protein A2V48_04980 [Candidatus Amesbacteria bacterium RBG_19FT_COMBO_48_16]OGC96744.1 MAG: hypothetical protein A3C34_03560 [Candidatus Amesbacteria bacterium RIFCSPHIGHO2_02_FULL_48_21]OGC97623.1 MAG: hypothetical protein A2W16_01175 [Candidatus Amesbacteria bacterium RBG_16_48_31]OGD01520.1 MAG: hypothetical protein A2354_00605 [Candidatus Amesbacteria bacterium RIFOXYB1_FUL
MELRLTASFKREYSKITRGNRDLKKKVFKQLRLLLENPRHPSLRLHKYHGKEWWSVSVDMSIRVLVSFEADYIVVFHIGKHEDVY